MKQSMYEHKKVVELSEFFISLNKRREKGVFFCRINGYNETIAGFIQRYYEEARKSGVVIEGKIPNPDSRNLSYYDEMMGKDFQMAPGFFSASLEKWLPRMNAYQRQTLAGAIYDTLDMLRKSGKNLDMLKNAYIKFMCWLYYKFERIVGCLGEDTVPKILYEGSIGKYELLLFSVLSASGCDIVLLQPGGDAEYRRSDPEGVRSDVLEIPRMGPFPRGYCLKKVRQDIQAQFEKERLYGDLPSVRNATNVWICGRGLEDVRQDISARGQDECLFYNCFYRIRGVEDKLLYQNELYQFQLEIENRGRKLLIFDEGIPAPSPEEIAGIRRSVYTEPGQMISGLAANIRMVSDSELKKLMRKAFVDVMLAKADTGDGNLNRLTNQGVYLLCWLLRYQKELFANWNRRDIACFVYFGACRSEKEALFLRLLARLPVDVVLFEPDRNGTSVLKDPLLYEISYGDSMAIRKFPRQSSEVCIGTAAYHAERELDEILYRDSGMYRNQQYSRANTVTLQTMYEEIAILWEQELKYRPNFSVVDEVVNLPVLYAKISGVRDGDVQKYWQTIKKLIVEDTLVIKTIPHRTALDANPMKASATEFYKNGRLQKRRIREHRDYKYGVLREEMQDHILDKLQDMIQEKIIRGTFENGTEYTIVSTVLNFDKEIIRMIQKFDFTKKNPKIIYICVGEETLSLEDTIMAAFLSRIGFDILFWVPTGYRVVEKFLQTGTMEEHQLGEFVYDMQIPDFDRISSEDTRRTWRQKIFRRGT